MTLKAIGLTWQLFQTGCLVSAAVGLAGELFDVAAEFFLVVAGPGFYPFLLLISI